MKVLTAAAMRAVDRRAIEEIGIPGPVLMENAALGVVEAIAERFAETRAVAILCGPGNNGGDGLAIARQLATRGYEVETLLARFGRPLAADADAQLQICRRLGIDPREIDGGAGGDLDVPGALAVARQADLVVDALFGTGLDRPLAGLAAELVEGLAELGRPVVAVDVPSGLSGSLGHPIGPHVRANLTVTFAAPKIAHVLWPAAGAVGELAIADLGFPSDLVDEADGDLFLATPEEIAPLLPRRAADAHKGDVGHALVVAGSPGKAGAAILAARAAVRGGAGLVTAAVPAPLLAVLDGGSVESMTLALPAAESGEIAAGAVAAVLAALAGKRALALGPGLGQAEETAAAVRALALAAPVPLVLDADGLNAFAGRAEALRERAEPTLLTPHPGELARLLVRSTAEIESDRPAAVRGAVAATGAVVVLKGHRTLVAREGEVWINPTGNAAMASGGSGDVLTGLLAALLAQGLAAWDAARLGVYLHGLAGDLAVERAGARGFAAADLIDHLPAAFRALAE